MTAQRSRAALTIAALCGFVAALVVVALIAASAPEVRGYEKRQLIGADAAVFGGYWRRLYHHQHLPRTSPRPSDSTAYAWLGAGSFLPIAHALGPRIETGPNTLATFHRAYDLRFRLFEVDLAMTRDRHLVCYHGEDEADLDTLTLGRFESLGQGAGAADVCDFQRLIALAEQFGDARFVLDVKTDFDQAYAFMRQSLAGHAVGRSFIPQVYDFDQLEGLRRAPLFAGEIFTSYLSALTVPQMITYARRFGVRAVTLTADEAMRPGFKAPPDIAILVQPVDQPFLAQQLRRAGMRGVYTSYLPPQWYPALYR